jgi:hypothetical protein
LKFFKRLGYRGYQGVALDLDVDGRTSGVEQ